jgi:hypothetical protein
MVREVVIEQGVPKVKPDFLEAFQELQESIDELAGGIRSLAGPIGHGFPMTAESWNEFGALLRLIIWVRMYACELSARKPELQALNSLIDPNRPEEHQQVRWVFNGLSALDTIHSYAEEVSINLLIKKHGLGARSLVGLHLHVKNFKRNLDLFVTHLERFAQAGLAAHRRL